MTNGSPPSPGDVHFLWRKEEGREEGREGGREEQGKVLLPGVLVAAPGEEGKEGGREGGKEEEEMDEGT